MTTPSTPPLQARRGLGRVAFLARLDTIRQALGQGWPMRSVYNQHADHLGITYSQFTRYVHRYLRVDQTAQATSAEPAAPPSPPTQAAAPTPGPKKVEVNLPQFHWDPTPLRKEDII